MHSTSTPKASNKRTTGIKLVVNAISAYIRVDDLVAVSASVIKVWLLFSRTKSKRPQPLPQVRGGLLALLGQRLSSFDD
jgi:hypothetical protein